LLSELLQAVKRAALDAVEATQPAAPFIGTVTSEQPLQIQLHQRLILENPHLVFLSAVSGTLETGDRVALLRFQGGQKFLVLGIVS